MTIVVRNSENIKGIQSDMVMCNIKGIQSDMVMCILNRIMNWLNYYIDVVDQFIRYNMSLQIFHARLRESEKVVEMIGQRNLCYRTYVKFV